MSRAALILVLLLAPAGVHLLPLAEAQASGVTSGLRGYYYARADWSKLHTIRLDPQVDFTWGSGSPVAGVPADAFSVRWLGWIEAPVSGPYTFYMDADDAATLYIDGVAVTGEIWLGADDLRPLRIDYREGSGNAEVTLSWFGPWGSIELVPETALWAQPLESPVVGDGTGLLGYYYAANDWTHLGFTRVDASPNFDWGSTSPGAPLGGDSFSVRWLGTLLPQYTETYTFWVRGDDAASLWVNGALLHDQRAAEAPSVGVPLVAGVPVDIKVELREGCCNARVGVKWESQSTPYQDLPRSQLTPAVEPTKLVGAGTGLLGYYYAASDWTHLGFTRVDPSLDLNWGSASPGTPLPADTFTVRWLGWIEPQLSEPYTFSLLGDDRASLWVGDQRTHENVTGETRVTTGPLVAGERYPVKLEMREGCCNARVRLRWESPNTTLQVIPATQLHPATLPPALVGDGTGLRAHYYDATDHTQLGIVRVDPVLDLNWGSGSPGAPIAADSFSARWTGEIAATRSEPYRFYLLADDRASLWIDGVRLIDNASGETASADVPFVAGARHDIMVEQVEGCCNARVRLRWESPNTTLEVVPAAQLFPAPLAPVLPGSGDGLRGEYHQGTTFSSLRHARIDPQVDFNWGGAAPAPGVPADSFTVRWTGHLMAPSDGEYRFYLRADDRASLWLDDALVLSEIGAETRTAPIALEAGSWHSVRIDMREGCCNALARLRWEADDIPLATVPQAYLASGGFGRYYPGTDAGLSGNVGSAGTRVIEVGGAATWLAADPAAVAAAFGTGEWSYSLALVEPPADAFRVSIGWSDGSVYTAALETGPLDAGACTSAPFVCAGTLAPASPVTLPAGARLAMRVESLGAAALLVREGSPSTFLAPPASTPAAPVPELATFALVVVGLALLAARRLRRTS